MDITWINGKIYQSWSSLETANILKSSKWKKVNPRNQPMADERDEKPRGDSEAIQKTAKQEAATSALDSRAI